ncbi:hypothetical protein QTV44_002480 [Vibrio vulnificus]|nr:hypothetical protein [Vibrio vulnificus]
MTQAFPFIDGQHYHTVLRRIDSVWTLSFTIQDGQARIERYSRDTAIGYEQEQCLFKHVLIEDDNRHVKQIELYTPSSNSSSPSTTGAVVATLRVINSQHVFSYK